MVVPFHSAVIGLVINCHRVYVQFYSVFLGMVFCTETYGWGASSSLFLDLSTGFMGVWRENQWVCIYLYVEP